ncbi:MAG: hypothetical protein WD751_10475 [Anaerolineales bacterium]
MQTVVLYLIAVVAVVAMWRGLWGLMDLYLWRNNPRLSYWVTFVAGFVVLAAVLLLVPK